jgi:hypothetical protein
MYPDETPIPDELIKNQNYLNKKALNKPSYEKDEGEA